MCAPNIALIGGSFDPVHIGHLIVAESARCVFHLEHVIFIPAARSPLKDPPRASEAARIRMLQLATAGNAAFQVSDMEIRRGGPSFTYDTVVQFRREYPQAKLFFILGADAFRDLRLWHRREELSAAISFLVAPRPDCEPPAHPGIPVKWTPIPCPTIGISSSAIRDMISGGRSIRYLVPDPVLDYIARERIYDCGRHKTDD